MERRSDLIINEEQLTLFTLSFEPPFHLLQSVNEVIAGIQRILPSAFALGMGLGLAVLSDRLLEFVELGRHVRPTVTETKAPNWPYALFIQAITYCCSKHRLIDVADCSLLITGQINVRHTQNCPCVIVAWLPPYISPCHWQAARAYGRLLVQQRLQEALEVNLAMLSQVLR